MDEKNSLCVFTSHVTAARREDRTEYFSKNVHGSTYTMYMYRILFFPHYTRVVATSQPATTATAAFPATRGIQPGAFRALRRARCPRADVSVMSREVSAMVGSSSSSYPTDHFTHPDPPFADCDNGQCYCRESVEGPNCDQCQEGYFGLGSDPDKGCSQCWCSGVTSQCSQSQLYWSTLRMSFSDDRHGVKMTDE